MKQKASWSKMAALATTLGLAAVGLTGCSGGSNVLGGGNPVVNGTFTGSSANLGAGRTGTFELTSRTDNTVEGTLTVVAPPTLQGRISAAAVILPAGLYNFSGTRNGSSFSANGHFNGTPAFDFTIGGTLSTTANAGNWSITGSVNGEPFEFTGSVNVTTGGGGGGGGNGTFTFSANSSNANTGSFSSIANVGTSVTAGANRLLSGTFTVATSATNLRVISVALTKTSAFAAGDTFNLSDNDSPNAGNGAVIYGEGAPTNKAWISHAGTAKITAISGTKVTIQVTNAAMQPSTLAGPGQTNLATGNFTLNGGGAVTVTGL